MHQRRGRNRPAIAGFRQQEFRRNFRIGQEHLIERGMAVHLAQGLHIDAWLFDIDDEKTEAMVLRHIPVGARQQQPVLRVMGAGGPDLLAVDDPLVPLEIGPRRRAGKIGTAARLAEQLAPSVLASQDPAQELFLVHVAPVQKDRRGGEITDPGFRHADGADAFHFGLNHTAQRIGQAPAVPIGRPCRRAPTGIDQPVSPFDEAEIRVPVGFEPGAGFLPDGVFGRFAHVSPPTRSSAASSTPGDMPAYQGTPRSSSRA